MKEIAIYETKHYGVNHLYVVDDKIRHAIEQMTGQRTLTTRIKRGLEELGFTFKLVVDPMALSRV